MTYLTTRQVADAVSLWTRQVEKWPAKATPNRFRRAKRQGRYWWRADALIEWLTERGYPEKASRLAIPEGAKPSARAAAVAFNNCTAELNRRIAELYQTAADLVADAKAGTDRAAVLVLRRERLEVAVAEQVLRELAHLASRKGVMAALGVKLELHADEVARRKTLDGWLASRPTLNLPTAASTAGPDDPQRTAQEPSHGSHRHHPRPPHLGDTESAPMCPGTPAGSRVSLERGRPELPGGEHPAPPGR